MTVAVADPDHALVLRGGIPMGSAAAPFDCTWAFVLREEPGGTTRLVSRERYGYLRWSAGLVVLPTSVISFVMQSSDYLTERPADEPRLDRQPTSRGP